MIKIRYYTNMAPHYRRNLWELFLSEKNFEIDIFFGTESKYHKIKQIDFNQKVFAKNQNKLHRITNINIFHVLVYQIGVITDALKYRPDISLFLGEAYVISTWIAALIFKLKGVKVVFWGHGLYGKESFLKKHINLAFIRLADMYLSYNNYGKNNLIKNGICSSKISVIYNSLDHNFCINFRHKMSSISKSNLVSFFSNPNLNLLIFIGRLTYKKKLHLLINACTTLNKEEVKFNLLIIGDGYEKVNLENLGQNGIKHGYIHFLGELYNEEEIANYIGIADLCVSPGNVGLTAIHALSYGTPVCTHNNFANQMPEFESIEEGKTGTYFNESDVSDLTVTISDWFKQNISREEIRNYCFKKIDEKYNPAYQLKLLKNVIKKLTEYN